MSLAEPSAEESHAFISYLRGLPDVPDLVRFFDRGGYFTVHQRDAVSVAQEYYKTNAVIKYMHVRGARPGADPREGGTPYVSVSRAMTTTILRSLLLERRKRVEVYRLSGREWALARRGSPGNLSAFEDELLRDASVPATSVTLAVRLGPPVPSGQRRLGVALADPTQRWLRVVELGDDDQFSALESLAVQHGARECVIASDTAGAERAKLDEAMQRCEVCLTEAKRATFAGKDADADLARLSGQPAGAALPDGVRDSALCRGAASAIIAYLDVMADTASHAQWQLGTADLEQFMRLDAGAVRALSVEPAADERAREASLVGLLNRCRTPMGTRLLRARLHQPLRSAYDIERRLDLVQVFVDDALLRAQLQGSLLGKGIPDLERLGRRFGAGKAGLPELWRAYQFTERLPDLTKALDDLVAAGGRGSELVGEKYAAPLRTAGADFVKLQQLVRASISLEAAAQGEYLIQPRYDPELTELYAEKEAAMGGLQEHVGSVAAALGFRGKDAERVKLVADVGTGLQLLRVTRKDEPVLRNKPGYAVLTTRKDGVTFTAPGTRALATRWDAATRAYREKQAALVAKVLQVAGTFAPVLAACAGVLADLDVSVALAVAAVSAPTPYVRPTILPPTEPRRIVLKGCRHPCMEAISAGGAFIPNDVALEHGASHFQIVTGPNMGGKSTYIRAAGISVLLAHAGSFVPCDEAAISLTDAILARVGAGDCQARGLSTFMGARRAPRRALIWRAARTARAPRRRCLTD